MEPVEAGVPNVLLQNKSHPPNDGERERERERERDRDPLACSVLGAKARQSSSEDVHFQQIPCTQYGLTIGLKNIL